MSKLLTVFGATGLQGGSLIQYALQNPLLSETYRFRGVTRDASKASAVTLKEKGVEIVEADMDDPTSLTKAVEGSYAVFAVTNYWEKASASVEVAQGKAVADAAVAAGVTLLIWSSLPSVAEMSSGKLTRVKHFESKVEVERYIRTLPITGVFFLAGFYMQNMKNIFGLRKNAAGDPEFAQSWPSTTHLPLIDITDIGKYLAPALLDPEKYHNARFTGATAYYTSLEMVDAWSKVTGKNIKFVQTEPGSMRGNMTEEMLETMKESTGLLTEYEYFGSGGPNDLAWTIDQLGEGVKLTSWEDFVKINEPWLENL